MPNFGGRPSAAFRLYLIATALVLVAVLGFAPMGTAEDKTARPLPSSPAPARHAAGYAGADTCIACHSEVSEMQQKDWHSKLIATRPGSKNCEECHGPSAAHSEDPETVPTCTNVTKVSAEKSAAACLRCHEGQHRSMDWKASDHARANVACWSCHSPAQRLMR